ncbi:hypothetical protein [Dactylosporangium darangshiense]|uniref:Uncharacterized protein n=1 Tax=Dactylosporangium darangshiense TaxID=579108 RepID=A0ABP8DTA3_9ACTN
MEIKGNQYGVIQNADAINNYGGVGAGASIDARSLERTIDALRADVVRAREENLIEPGVADAVDAELVAAGDVVRSGPAPAAAAHLGRAARLVQAASTALPYAQLGAALTAAAAAAAGILR